MDLDAMRLGQFRDQFVKRDPALRGDTGLDPVGHAGQLAVPAAVALQPRRERSCLTPQLDQIVHEPRRHPKVTRRLAMPVTLVDKRDNALA